MSGINALKQASKDTNFIKNADDKDIIKVIAQAMSEKNFSGHECGTAFNLLAKSNIKWKNLDQISEDLIIKLTNYIELCTASEIIFILEGLSNLGILFKNNESIYIRALTQLNNNLYYFKIDQTIFLLSALCKAEIKYSDLEYYQDIQDILIDFITKNARSFNKTIIFNIFCFLDDFFNKSNRINSRFLYFKNIFLHSISVESEKFTPQESIDIWSLFKKINIKEWSDIPKNEQYSIFDAIQNNINEFENNPNRENEFTSYSNNLLKYIKEYKVKWYLLSNPAQNNLIKLIKKKTETCSLDTLNFLLSISKSLELKWTYIPYFDEQLINCVRNNLNSFDNDLILETLFTLYKYEILWDHLQGLDVLLLDFINKNINNLSFFQISSIIISLSKFDINWGNHNKIYKNLLDQFDTLNLPQNSLDIHTLANLFLSLAYINALNFERLRTLIKNFDKEALTNPMQFINNVPDKHILKFYTAICYLQLELAEKNLPEEEDFKNFIKVLTRKSNVVQKTIPVTTSQEQKDITKIIQKFCNTQLYVEHQIKCKMVDILIHRYNAPPLVIEIDGKYHFTPKETYILSTTRKQQFLKRCGYEVISINLLKEWSNKTDYDKEKFIYNLLINNKVIKHLNDSFTKDCNMLPSGLSSVSAPSHDLFFNRSVSDSQINLQLPINTSSMHHITKQETPSRTPRINENIYAAKPGAFSSSHASLKLQKANSSISHQSAFVLSAQYPINAIGRPSSIGSYGRNSGTFSVFSTQQHSSSPTLERKNENEQNKRQRLQY